MATILIVDDSKIVRKLIMHILEKNNYRCLEAEDGIDALEKLVMNKVDMIIADLNMPKMTGLELIKTVRESDAYNEVPILMLTTETGDETKKACLDAGANVYLSKPAPQDFILKNVKELL